MKKVRPKLIYQDAHYDSEQRWVLTDGGAGFNSSIILAAEKTRELATAKAIKELERLKRQLKEEL